MAHKSNLVAIRASWLKRALQIEWGWERKGLDSGRLRKVYQIYKDCKNLGVKSLYYETARKFNVGKRRHLRVTIGEVRCMIRSYRNYLKAIEDRNRVKSEDR